MTDQPYSAQLRVIHAQLGECNIFPDSVANRAGLYVSATGKRLAKLVEQAEISMQLIPFVDTPTGPVKVYETSVKGKLNGLPVEVYLRECKDTLDGGSYFARLVVTAPYDGKNTATIAMYPDGDKGLGCRLVKYQAQTKPANERNTINGDKEKKDVFDAAMKKLGPAMPPTGIGADELIKELFA